MTLDWSAMQVDSSQEVLFSEEVKNTDEDYKDAPWVPTFECESTASHK